MPAWTEDEVKLLRKAAVEGVSAQGIGVRLKRRTTAVKKMAVELGIPLTNRADVRKSFGFSAWFSQNERSSDEEVR